MPAKIPQDVRERQLRELAEVDGYTFVGWVDSYKSGKSYITFKCAEHGAWDMRINNFMYGSRCPACGGSKPRTQVEVEALVSASLWGTDSTFVRWETVYLNQYSKLIIRCAVHGDYVQMFSGLLQGKQCYKCSRGQSGEDEMRNTIQCLTESSNCEFVEFIGDYKTVQSRAIFNCHEHGKWDCSINSFVNAGSRCSDCRDFAYWSMSTDEWEERLRVKCEHQNFHFVGWESACENQFSKVVMECPEHGRWVTSTAYILRGSGCPQCATTGYQSSKSGTLYALLSECGSMIKIGISNIPEARHAQLARKTPFKFAVHRQIHCEDGTTPPMLERMFHNEFPSAGLRGFDGATEWRVWYPEVNTWFDLLGG